MIATDNLQWKFRGKDPNHSQVRKWPDSLSSWKPISFTKAWCFMVYLSRANCVTINYRKRWKASENLREWALLMSAHFKPCQEYRAKQQHWVHDDNLPRPAHSSSRAVCSDSAPIHVKILTTVKLYTSPMKSIGAGPSTMCVPRSRQVPLNTHHFLSYRSSFFIFAFLPVHPRGLGW